MSVIHKKPISAGVVAICSASILAGCTQSAAAQPLERADVTRIVETCANTVSGLDRRLAQDNGPAAYQAASLVGSTCQDASREFLRPGTAQACRDLAQAGVILGDMAGDAINDPRPANRARLDTIRSAFDDQLGKCQAAIG